MSHQCFVSLTVSAVKRTNFNNASLSCLLSVCFDSNVIHRGNASDEHCNTNTKSDTLQSLR